MVWIVVEVVSGPKERGGGYPLNESHAALFLHPDPIQGHPESTLDITSFPSHSRRIGRMEIFRMFGDFDGIEKISRNHLSIEANFWSTRGPRFTVYDIGSTNGTTFPEGNHGGSEVSVRLGNVLTIKLSQSNYGYSGFGKDIVSSEANMTVTLDQVRAELQGADGWGNTFEAAVNPSAMRIDSGHRGLGQQWVVVLSDNPSTGYEWSIQPGLDDTILVVSSWSADELFSGRPRRKTFVFEAVGAGTTSILIHYKRSESDPPAKEYSQEITVIE